MMMTCFSSFSFKPIESSNWLSTQKETPTSHFCWCCIFPSFLWQSNWPTSQVTCGSDHCKMRGPRGMKCCCFTSSKRRSSFCQIRNSLRPKILRRASLLTTSKKPIKQDRRVGKGRKRPTQEVWLLSPKLDFTTTLFCYWTLTACIHPSSRSTTYVSLL